MTFKLVGTSQAETSTKRVSMTEFKSEQTNITAHGDVAAGNITKTTFMSGPSPSRLHDLLSKAAEELKNNPAYREIIFALQRYIDPVDGEEIVGLENKLVTANRSSDVKKAKELKEGFTKILFEHILSPSAQSIYAHLLARIETLFDLKTRPLLRAQASETIIDNAIADLVICPLTNEIEAANELGIHDCDIRGMLYYLTGTCHISWVE